MASNFEPNKTCNYSLSAILFTDASKFGFDSLYIAEIYANPF